MITESAPRFQFYHKQRAKHKFNITTGLSVLLNFDFSGDQRKVKWSVKFPSEHYGKGEVLVYDVFPLTLISLMSISQGLLIQQS